MTALAQTCLTRSLRERQELAGCERSENKKIFIASGRFYQATATGYKPNEAGLNWVLRSFFQSVYYSFMNIYDRSPHTDIKQVGGDGLTGCLYIP